MNKLTGALLISAMALAGSVGVASTSHAADAAVNLRRTVTVDVVEKTKDAVVYISSTKIVAQRFSPFGNDPFWQQFDFGDIRYVPVGSLGSGFIVHPEGYIVTNSHVIDRARQIDVELLDGRKFPAELISADAEADLAILKISADRPLPTLELGDSADLMIGEPVIAVGNPLGYSHSVSTGIVSAIHRDLKAPDNSVVLTDLIQTDAAINPGNSGGPLLNAYGQVIGINTAIRGDAQNIGFAIQVNRLRDLIPELMNPAQVRKLEIPLKLRERRTLTPPANIQVVIERVDGGHGKSAATQIVRSIAGKQPRNIVDAYAILLKQQANRPFEVELEGQKPLKIEPRPAPLPDAIVKARQRLGITVEPVTPMLAEKYGLNTEQGMFVTEVIKDSVADRAGIQPGDVILQIGRYPVLNLERFSVVMQHLPERGRVRVRIMRGPQIGDGFLQL
ncbi:trypsin-like peptidase domain-containing protein [Fontivita pretiosa]|uniref:trypsin-like peptidase domain-containing protein n=1 Tax=Fontivita pretiosa TaxID=2989684 RepID=UPI003D1644F0